MAGAQALIDELRGALEPSRVLSDPELCEGFETDWTRRFSGPSVAVARPVDAREVAAVLGICSRHGVGIVPQGGNTGLVGGSVPRAGELVLSLTAMRGLGEVDAATMRVEAAAGETLGALQRHSADAGLDAGVDFAARDSATLGGILACDAGGIRAIRFGTARARVAGLEAVLADGSIVSRMSGLDKDNAGYDLASLLIGSEGTLGVITRVGWRLVPRLERRVAALVGLPSLADAAELMAAVRPALPSISAAEFFTDEGLDLALEHLGMADPLAERSPVYVLLEAAGGPDPLVELAAALESGGVEDALIADESSELERLWQLREAHTEAIAAAGVPHKLDVGVPLARLADFAEQIRAALRSRAPAARTILFGHLGDGNVHVNLLGLDPGDEAADEVVLRVAAACGGTISAEHGVGVAKAGWLGLTRSATEIELMRRIKRSLDPAGILNPGAVLTG